MHSRRVGIETKKTTKRTEIALSVEYTKKTITINQQLPPRKTVYMAGHVSVSKKLSDSNAETFIVNNTPLTALKIVTLAMTLGAP